MAPSDPSSRSPSRSSTPTASNNPRFVSQNATAEDLLKTQTVGLVQLDDFRKRRAEAIEAKGASHSGASTPATGASTPQPTKKKRKTVAKGKLSFGLDDDEETDSSASVVP
ncbi:hypothetical protein LTS18_013416, partial [Coniosporium uncinatum]